MTYRHGIYNVVREFYLRDLRNSNLCQLFWIDLGKIGILADMLGFLVGSRPMRLRSGLDRWLEEDASPGCRVVNVNQQPTRLGRLIERRPVPFESGAALR